MSDKKALLQEMFKSVFEKDEFDLALVHKYFHSDYEQFVDGKSLNRDDFIEHMKALKSALKDVSITFKHLVAEGNAVYSLHIAEGTKPDGRRIKAQVNAYFQFEGNQLIFCDELTHMIEGEEADRDLGSRH